MVEDDKNKILMKEIYDFIKELYLEEEDKKIELREKYIKNKFSINRFKREQMQYEKVNDTNVGFFNPNTNMLNEKIESIKQEIEKLSMEQAEEERKIQVVEKRMDKISILRSLLAEKEEQERLEKEEHQERERLKREEKERKEKERLEKVEKECQEREKLEREKQEQKDNLEKIIQDQENNSAQLVLKTYETERQRIARDLHDTTVQNLTGLIHKVEYCLLLADKEPVKVKLELAAMQEILKSTIDEMRDIIYDLRPMSIDDLGLTEIVNKHIKQLEKEHEEITFDISIKSEEKKLDSMVGLTIFRIIQEACNNAIKHGDVSLIFISIEYKENAVEVSVEDDGIGFNYEEFINHKEENKEFGLSIMKERAELISGQLEIKSEEDKGTSIKLIVPIV